MNKFLVWWVSLRAAKGDAAYWQREAEKWERKYEAAIQVRDTLSKQLEETQAELFAARAPKDILRNLYPKVMPLPDAETYKSESFRAIRGLVNDKVTTVALPEGMSIPRELIGVQVIIDPTLPPRTVELRGANGYKVGSVHLARQIME